VYLKLFNHSVRFVTPSPRRLSKSTSRALSPAGRRFVFSPGDGLTSSHVVRVRARVPTEADPACKRQTLDRIHSTRSTLADEARTNERAWANEDGVLTEHDVFR